MQRFANRALLATFILLLHLLVIPLFGVKPQSIPLDAQAGPEAVLISAPPPPAKTPSGGMRAHSETAGIPAARPPALFTPPAISHEAQPDYAAALAALDRCAVNRIGLLAREDRARCSALGLGTQIAMVPGELHDKPRAQQAARWTAEIAARNTPLRVPCTFMAQTRKGSSVEPGVDFICVGVGALILLYDELKD